MQLFMRHPLLLRRLRRLLQLALPTAVAADTVRSVYVTCQLAQQRFEEWEQEDQEDTRREVRALLQRVVSRCAAADADFWPPGLAPSASAAGPASTQAGGAAGADLWHLMGLTGGATPAAADDAAAAAQQQPAVAASAEAAAFAELEAAQLLAFQLGAHSGSSSGAGEGASAARPQAQQQQAQQQASVVVVTLQDALSHVASNVAALSLPLGALMDPPPNVVRVTLSDVVDILGATPPARVAARRGEKVKARLLAAADAAADGLRASLPWPHLAVSRRSALRCSVDWRGLSWPCQPAPGETLERDLLACC